METPADDARSVHSADDPEMPGVIEDTERYETDDGMVFFDAANPLAWLQTEHTLLLDDQA